MTSPKFSMILPLHNAEKYMRTMLESIKKQAFKDYELICVCDSCEDNTEAIAREYSDIVVPVNFKRAGLSRNKGLELARGEWVLFADDDDYISDNQVFEYLANTVGKHGEDILFCGFDWQGVGRIIQTPEQHYAAVWNKAWRRAFIGETRFSDKWYGDDADFDSLMLSKGPRTWFVDRIIYYYNYMRAGSLSDIYARNRGTENV